jgi:hypothetical protein
MKLTRWRENDVASRMNMLSRTSGRGMVQEIDADPLASFRGEMKCALVRPPYQCMNTRRDPNVLYVLDPFVLVPLRAC